MTPAHSTLCLDGQNSSEVWGGFRVGRRARVRDVEFFEASEGPVSLKAKHDGYSHLRGKPTHTRKWHLNDDSLTVEDQIEGKYDLSGVVRFHIHPDIELKLISSQLIELRVADTEGDEFKKIHVSCSNEMSIEPSSYHPEFGKSLETSCICVEVPMTHPRIVETTFCWAFS